MATVTTWKQLAQRNITSTSPTIVYSNYSAQQTTFIKTVIICNLTGSSCTYRVYVNQNGSQTADQFALIKDITLAANASDQRIYPGDSSIILVGANANVIVKCSVANAITVTLYGMEVIDS